MTKEKSIQQRRGDFCNQAEFADRIFGIQEEAEFCELALYAFEYQKVHCPVYKQYIELTGKSALHPASLTEIPFLPINFFKHHKIISSPSTSQQGHEPEYQKIFTSSATTGMTPSKHYVTSLELYERSFTEGFRHFYGNIQDYNLLALLPSYLEREGSSLVYMADHLIRQVKDSGGEGGFYLYNHKELLAKLVELAKTSNRKTILLGVSFALIDFANYIKENAPASLQKELQEDLFSELTIMETGGMKGRGKELTRSELHTLLANSLHTRHIHSEYGMAELLSQAYMQDTSFNAAYPASDAKTFFTPPWMKVLVRDLYDPFDISESGKGGINIIDLANINSCCFIETEDRGQVYSNAFTIDGRIANSELRGCNLLIL